MNVEYHSPFSYLLHLKHPNQ